MSRYRPFPPGRPTMLVSTRSPSELRAGLASLAATARTLLGAQHAVYAATRLVGTAALPGPAVAWQPPAWVPAVADLVPEVERATGRRSLAVAAVHRRPSAPEGGVGLLLVGDGGGVFVKLRPPGDRIATEAAAAEAVGAAQPRSFAVPEVLARGSLGGAAWLAFEALPPVISAPLRPSAARVVAAEVAEVLAPGWAHGDFAPWNVRRAAGRTWVLDWEGAGPAPAGADATYYEIAWAVVRRAPAPRRLPPEALDHWYAVVAGRPASSFNRRMLRVIDRARMR